jgi:hypothetical protein
MVILAWQSAAKRGMIKEKQCKEWWYELALRFGAASLLRASRARLHTHAYIPRSPLA